MTSPKHVCKSTLPLMRSSGRSGKLAGSRSWHRWGANARRAFPTYRLPPRRAFLPWKWRGWSACSAARRFQPSCGKKLALTSSQWLTTRTSTPSSTPPRRPRRAAERRNSARSWPANAPTSPSSPKRSISSRRGEQCRSRQQQHRASGSPLLDVAMRGRGVGERIGAADLDLDNSAFDQVEQLGGGRAHGWHVGGQAAQRGTADRERATLGEQKQIERRRVPRGVAVVHQHSERAHAVERRREGVLADAVEHSRDALRCDRLDGGDEVHLAIEDGVIAAMR